MLHKPTKLRDAWDYLGKLIDQLDKENLSEELWIKKYRQGFLWAVLEGNLHLDATTRQYIHNCLHTYWFPATQTQHRKDRDAVFRKLVRQYAKESNISEAKAMTIVAPALNLSVEALQQRLKRRRRRDKNR